jgi:hypothetical protein
VYWTGGKEGVWGHRATDISAKLASDWLQHFEIPSSLRIEVFSSTRTFIQSLTK